MGHSDFSRKTTIGIIGCGNIFSAYAKGIAIFKNMHLKACADLNEVAAKKQAEAFGLEAVTIDALLKDPDIDIVVNLTIPKVHAEVSRSILNAGKHAYSEKPLAIDLESGKDLMDLARSKGLRMGCAPDTFLGAGLQTSRKCIDDGWIGTPVAGTAVMMSPGPESWHPNPGFFYQRGGGPMFDMGPYYVAALVHLLGPVRAVSAMTSCLRKERMATSAEQFGKMLPVEIPTHYSGSLLFESGVLINMAISFDVVAHRHSSIEIYGTQGSIEIPDPNTFGGPVILRRKGDTAWKEIPLAFPYHENSRGIGVADMAYAIASDRPHRCSGSLALHVLEVMSAFEESNNRQSRVNIETRCDQPELFPLGVPVGLLGN